MTKTIFFDKTKTIRLKTWLIGLTNDKTMTTKDYSHKFTITIQLTSYCPGPTLFLYRKNPKKKKKFTNTKSLKPVHTITKSHKQLHSSQYKATNTN